MSTSRFGAVVDGLVTLVGATSVTADATFDGPATTDIIPDEYVVVGGTEDPDDDAGEFSQEWHGIGARTRLEQGQVECAVLVGTGDDVVKTARDRALAIVAEIENALRTDPTVSGAVDAGWCHLTSGRPSQRRNQNGLYARIAFTVSYQSHV